MYTYGRKTGCRVSLDYTYRGMKVAFLENDVLRTGVLIDKGADIFEFTFKPLDLDFLWQSPIEMRKPFVATSALPEGAFHDYFYGGWQEVLPSAGWASEPYMGTFQGLHGEVSLLPFEASIVEDTPEVVSLKTRVRTYRSPLSLERTMTLKKGIAALIIHEPCWGAEWREYQRAYHRQAGLRRARNDRGNPAERGGIIYFIAKLRDETGKTPGQNLSLPSGASDKICYAARWVRSVVPTRRDSFADITDFI